MKPFAKISNPRAIRDKLGMNQTEFWSALGITQSGGSRYESGRSMPRPVRELMRLVYIERVNLADIKGADLRAGAALRKEDPIRHMALATAKAA